MRGWLGSAVLMVVLVTGCSADVSEASFDVTEFEIAGPETLAPGTRSRDVANTGEFPHTLVVTDSTGQVVAATGLIPPGETTTIELDLGAGVYSVTCRIVAQNDQGDLIDHFEAGMHASLTVNA